MSISFQLIELPEDEQVASRQVSLPASGGTIGRSFECSIQLPDFGRTLSRVHAEVLPSPNGGFQLIDRSTNGVFVNNVRLGKGESHRLSDGDNIRLGAYTLLFSDMESLFASAPAQAPEELASSLSDSPFDQQAVLDSGADSILGVDEMFTTAAQAEPEQDKPVFSADNVTGEDLYGYDPFEDDEKWEMEQKEGEEDFSDEELVMISEADAVNRPTHNALTVADPQVAALESSIDRLNRIIEQQQKAILASVDRDRLVSCIESTLNRFLEELDPDQLEEEFNDYITGWGRKDKKYWALYKKQFKRKQERRDFYRKFSALLFEELREQR